MIQNKNKFMMNISKENNIYPFEKFKNIMVHFFEDNPPVYYFVGLL